MGPLVALVSAAIWVRTELSASSSDNSSCLPGLRNTYHHAIIVDAAHNRGTCACSLGQRDTPGMEGRVAVVVGEIKAGHGDGVESG